MNPIVNTSPSMGRFFSAACAELSAAKQNAAMTLQRMTSENRLATWVA